MEKEIKVTLTAKQAANYLGISYWLVTKLTRERKIPHIKLGSKILFRQETLDQFMEEQEEQSIQAT